MIRLKGGYCGTMQTYSLPKLQIMCPLPSFRRVNQDFHPESTIFCESRFYDKILSLILVFCEVLHA